MDTTTARTFLDENPRTMRRRGKGINGDIVMMVRENRRRWRLGTPVMVAPSVMFATEDHVTTCRRVALNNSGSLRPPQKPVNTA